MKTLNRKIKIKRIDHDKIAEGQSIYKGLLFDINDKCISVAPYIIKEFPVVELKILPGNFEKALNSGDLTVSEAYKKWKEKEFSDWHTPGKLENEWRSALDNLTSLKLIDVFPEAKPYLQEKLERWNRYLLTMENIIERQLEWASKHKDKFSRWFWEGVIVIQDGSLLELVEKEIWKLKFLLKIVKPKNQITPLMTEQAKRFPLPQLLGLPVKPKQMVKCPYHSEKKASFYITQDKDGKWFGHCFGCDKSVDSIQYLIDQGLSFPEAVLQLI